MGVTLAKSSTLAFPPPPNLWLVACEVVMNRLDFLSYGCLSWLERLWKLRHNSWWFILRSVVDTSVRS